MSARLNRQVPGQRCGALPGCGDASKSLLVRPSRVKRRRSVTNFNQISPFFSTHAAALSIRFAESTTASERRMTIRKVRHRRSNSRLSDRLSQRLSVTHKLGWGPPQGTGLRGFSNRTQIFADSADQHGFAGNFFKRRQRRDLIDPGVNTLHSTENNQRESVRSVVIRVPLESLGEQLYRESRDVCKRQLSKVLPIPPRHRGVPHGSRGDAVASPDCVDPVGARCGMRASCCDLCDSGGGEATLGCSGASAG